MQSFRPSLSWQLFLALVVATLLACGVPAANAGDSFKASVAITEVIQPIGAAPCFLVGEIAGTGQATQLGKVTVVSSDCINPLSQTLFSFASNQLVLTGANGSQIFAIYSGTLTTEGGVGVITGGYQIVGGTGRYSQATGAGSVQGMEDMSTGKGLVQLIGTMSY
jgi:hypothetical protein